MNATTYTTQQLENISERIQHAAVPEQPLTKAQAIRRLAPTLAQMRKRGHTLSGIASILTAEGLPVSVRLLSQQLKSSSTGRATARPAKAQAQQAQSHTPAKV